MGETLIERIDSFPYRHRVSDIMRPPIDISGEATLEEAARRMQDASVGSLLVLDPSGSAVGILTERDLTRVIASQGAEHLKQVVATQMSRPVATVPSDSFLHVAMAACGASEYDKS
jgi:CBS domain-containing protein